MFDFRSGCSSRRWAIAAGWLCFWLAPQGVCADEHAEGVMRAIFAKRMQLTLAELEWTFEVLENRKHPVLVGSVHEYHAWYDYENGQVRVDVTTDCPRNSELSYSSRFAFSGDQLLIVPTERLAGEDRCGLDRSIVHDRVYPTVFQLSADLRLLGVLPAGFSVLKNYSPEDVLEIVYSSTNCDVSEDKVDGHVLTTIRFLGYKGGDCELTYWLDAASGGMPVRIVCEAVTEMGLLKTEIQTRWRVFDEASGADGKWLPIECESTRSIDGDLETRERVTMKRVNIGERPNQELFTWKGMGLPDDYVVRQVSGKTKTMKQWDIKRQAFGEWTPTLLVESGVPSPTGLADQSESRRTRMILIFASFLVGLGFLSYAVFRRRVPRKDGTRN